jgi:hypothetical protein
MFHRNFLVNSVGDSRLAPVYGRKCEKFISDPNNHSLVGNPTAGRLRRLIVVQIKIRLIKIEKNNSECP